MMQPAGGKTIRQMSSHSALLRSVEVVSPLSLSNEPQDATLDAIIIPATRRANTFDELIKLSALLGAQLVVICSKLAKIEHVSERVARTPGARALVIEIPKNYRVPRVPNRTSSSRFHNASGGRASDLSAKRNLGLLLARLNGWRKIVFVDDDITSTDPEAFRRLARRLEHAQIAGMVCRSFPDNSVVCHARRVAGLPQDNFVSGSVLGVYCADLPLSFFPDVYNEDWFFFSKAVARCELADVGNAEQRAYKPFADPQRARHEEFGDLLAEGLFSLIGVNWARSMEARDEQPIDHRQLFALATVEFWTEFIRARRDAFQETREKLKARTDSDARQALRSLDAAEHQLDTTITPELCTAFLAAFQEDLDEWEIAIDATNNVSSVWEAMNHLGVRQWRIAEFEDAHVEGPQGGATRRNRSMLSSASR